MAEKRKGKEIEVTEKVVSEAEELPKAIVRRVVKEKLSQLSTDSEISVLRDSLLAFSESARIFIHYLSATANDTCKESNRQIINAEDVFKALEEIEFPEFIGPLRASLEEFRQKNAEKKAASSKAKETPNKKDAKKRKESPAKSEGGRKKRREVEEGGEDDNAD
ncbi:DNA polymerase II subunit B4 [Castilleja foliolosa]|uniref:DNA polymerase II subunit B4 n=1 Tax=Castilleja foliolosa TaxID=1961234 RepID=A0ABD3BNJ2_9LAMI